MLQQFFQRILSFFTQASFVSKKIFSLNLGLKYSNKIKMESLNVSKKLTPHSPLAPSSVWRMLSYFLRQQINTVASSREIGVERRVKERKSNTKKWNKLSFLEERNTVRMRAKISPHTHTKNKFNINNSLVCEVYGAGLYKKQRGWDKSCVSLYRFSRMSYKLRKQCGPRCYRHFVTPFGNSQWSQNHMRAVG